MANQYILVNIEADESRLNASIFYRLTWVRINDMTRWEMTVDEAYRNWERCGWADICLNQRWGVYENLKECNRRTQKRVNVLTADSRPNRVIDIESQALAIDVVIAEQERMAGQYHRTIFDQVFITE